MTLVVGGRFVDYVLPKMKKLKMNLAHSFGGGFNIRKYLSNLFALLYVSDYDKRCVILTALWWLGCQRAIRFSLGNGEALKRPPSKLSSFLLTFVIKGLYTGVTNTLEHVEFFLFFPSLLLPTTYLPLTDILRYAERTEGS